ncbi:MAG: type IV secretory system conjugative DNA transfer family protein [Rhizobiaceae bacterium]|nr:type IV secretory system conjugative DNA transfer family protein [Rhizobiaceae bacterium]
MNDLPRRVIGLTFDGRPIYEPYNAGSSLTFAATGGGKTTCVSMPTVLSLLADTGRAIFINDVKSGEIAAQIAPLCEKYGRRFGIVDEFGERPELAPYRISLNPFGDLPDMARSNPFDLPFAIENINHVLTEEPKDDLRNLYWRNEPRGFKETGLNVLLAHAPHLVFPGGLQALLADPDSWVSALEIEAEEGEDHVKAAAKQILEMRRYNPEHYAQHLGAALMSLKPFASGALKNAGRTPTLTHRQLIVDGWVVCFINPVRHADRLGSFFALHFLSLLNEKLAGTPGRMDLILDEFCNAPLRDALNRITIQRSYGVRSHFLVQSRQDIVRKYGEKETAILEENCTVKQYLKITNYEEAERLSRAIGEQTTIGWGLGVSSDKDILTGNFNTGRDRVRSADELMRLPPDEQIIEIPGVGFIHCKKIRQNQIAPYCWFLGDNPLEGAALKADPRVTLRTPGRMPAPSVS